MIDIKELQRPLRERYEADPDSAPLTLTVRSAPSDLDDPLHVAIYAGCRARCGVAQRRPPGGGWRR